MTHSATLSLDTVDSIQPLLNAAFKALRKQNFIARQKFMCCGGCAGAEIATKLGERVKTESLDKVLASTAGACFYTKQDAECYNRRGYFTGLYIGFGPVHVSGVEQVFGLDPKHAGEAVALALRNAGLVVEWDSSPEQRIRVVGTPEGIAAGQRETARRAEAETARAAENAKFEARMAQQRLEDEHALLARDAAHSDIANGYRPRTLDTQAEKYQPWGALSPALKAVWVASYNKSYAEALLALGERTRASIAAAVGGAS